MYILYIYILEQLNIKENDHTYLARWAPLIKQQGFIS